jgi:hypothetical protein
MYKTSTREVEAGGWRIYSSLGYKETHSSKGNWSINLMCFLSLKNITFLKSKLIY